jgi:hypothetical protein
MEHCMRIFTVRVGRCFWNVQEELPDFGDLDNGFMRDFALAPWYED